MVNISKKGGQHNLFLQGSHGQGKVSEKLKNFKVREKSGNFELSQGNLKFWKKSGKSQGILLSIICGNPVLAYFLSSKPITCICLFINTMLAT